jgi:hypothetical protein
MLSAVILSGHPELKLMELASMSIDLITSAKVLVLHLLRQVLSGADNLAILR